MPMQPESARRVLLLLGTDQGPAHTLPLGTFMYDQRVNVDRTPRDPQYLQANLEPQGGQLVLTVSLVKDGVFLSPEQAADALWQVGQQGHAERPIGAAA